MGTVSIYGHIDANKFYSKNITQFITGPLNLQEFVFRDEYFIVKDTRKGNDRWGKQAVEAIQICDPNMFKKDELKEKCQMFLEFHDYGTFVNRIEKIKNNHFLPDFLKPSFRPPLLI